MLMSVTPGYSHAHPCQYGLCMQIDATRAQSGKIQEQPEAEAEAGAETGQSTPAEGKRKQAASEQDPETEPEFGDAEHRLQRMSSSAMSEAPLARSDCYCCRVLLPHSHAPDVSTSNNTMRCLR